MTASGVAPQTIVEVRREIAIGLAEITRMLRQAFDQRMGGMGLTGSRWRVIASLALEDGQTQASLAERLEITRVALGETIDRLERSGHVKRCADPLDRRKWRVNLTPLAQEVLPHLFVTAEALHAQCFRDLSDDEVAGLQSLVGRLRVRLLEMKTDMADEEAVP